MQRQYKELLITDEMDIARRAKAEGQYVVLSYPVQGMTKEDHLADYPYAVETTEQEPEEAGYATYLEHVLCRFKGEPCHILDTKRCRVREITTADVDRLYEIYADPQITEFMEGLYEKKEDEIAYTEDYIKCHYGFYDFGMWIVVDKETETIIGRAGFDMREGNENPELGFVICTQYQGRGYAAEVCEALLNYGKEELGFEAVTARVERGNIKSLQLLCKLGFGAQNIDEKKDFLFMKKILQNS